MAKNKTPRYVAPTLLALTLIAPIDSVAEEEVDSTTDILPPTSTSEQVLTLDTMAVTAEVAEAKLGGVDVKTLPFASTIINQDEIKRLKFIHPDELLDRIPGETQVRNLRIPNGSKSYTIPMIDGAALGSPLRGSTQAFGNNVNVRDIERIEIFKGPTSALVPNNAFGGTINVVTKGSKKLPNQNTRLWAEAGNLDSYRGGGSTQGSLKGVGYLFDLSSWNIGAYRDQTLIVGNDGKDLTHETGEERHEASGKLIFHPDELSSLVIRGSYLKDHLTTPGDLLESDFNKNDKGMGRQGTYSDKETFLGSAIYDRDMFTDGHLFASFNIKFLESTGISRFSGAHDDETIDINGKLSYKHDFDFWNTNIIVGTDIFQGINDDFNPSKISRGRKQKSSKDYATTDIYAGFAQLQFSPIENLQITAGVRHESIDLERTHTKENGKQEINSGSFSATLPKVGISYDFLDRHRVWFSYGEGFLVPSTSQLWTGRGNNPNLNPEEAEHFEIGLRGSIPIFGNDLTYDTSYYHQEISEYIVSRNLEDVVQNVNAGQVTIQGVETVLEYQPSDYIRFGITHTYSSNIYDRYINNKGVDLSGEELSRSPEHHINGRIAVMPMEGLAIELEIDSSTSYTTLDHASLDPKGRYSREERINLRATYDKGPFEIWFHALNLGDVKIDRTGYRTGSRGNPGERSYRTVDGLQIRGGIAYNF